MTPQIIFIILLAVNLVMAGYKHGKPKTGYNNLWIDIIALVLMILLLWWGGFFDPLFK